MKSADVKSAFYNSRSAPTTKYKLVDIGGSGSCRIFSVVWCPYQLASSDEPVIELWEGDPDSGGTKVYVDGCYVSNGYTGNITEGQQPWLNFEPFPSHYYLFKDDVWIRGGASGYGINNVTVTYQLGG